MNDPESLPLLPEPETAAPATRAAWFWQVLRLVQVRARFLVVLVVIGLVVGQWERLSGYWNWLTRRVLGQADRQSAVSSDTEFFCPMDPGVVSPWEDKCPICNMTLVRRKKGDAPILPEGVVARMQVSPYRLQLAGVRSSAVEYRPLVREVTLLGMIRLMGDDPADGLSVQGFITERDRPFVQLDQEAEVRLSIPEAPPARGRLVRLEPQIESRPGALLAEVRLENPGSLWQPGLLATVVLRTPLAEVEPYRSLARQPAPLRPGEPRVAFVSREHPDVVRLKPGRCPIDSTPLVEVNLTDSQRLDFWCPMHPEVFHADDGHECAKCNGMKLLPRIVIYAPPGHVLVVPASAVLSSGRGDIVYQEVSPGMLEGRQVKLGTRAGDYFPVLSGLMPGSRVVTAGAFLLDAETRLSGQASTAYFGAAGSSSP
jgi:multidrug efflux pump subunit AcrA (membrane-fusion protein)